MRRGSEVLNNLSVKEISIVDSAGGSRVVWLTLDDNNHHKTTKTHLCSRSSAVATPDSEGVNYQNVDFEINRGILIDHDVPHLLSDPEDLTSDSKKPSWVDYRIVTVISLSAELPKSRPHCAASRFSSCLKRVKTLERSPSTVPAGKSLNGIFQSRIWLCSMRIMFIH
ncbi:hypothetical protein BDW62DRAFT_191009 [Aspergillus aurantiobrunneus]